MPERPPIFLDTAYVYALVNTRDQWHDAATTWERRLATERRMLLTTEFVLLEVADGLAAVGFRRVAVNVIDTLKSSPLVEIVPATTGLFAAAFALYLSRQDKDWGLTDCSSFVTMNQHNVAAALTTDRHFSQAGFRPLLLDPLAPEG